MTDRTKETKRCISCGETKPLREYHARTRAEDGHSPKCKGCTRAYDRVRYVATSDEAKARAKAWAQANRGRRAVISRRWYSRNKESAARAVQAWRITNRDRSRAIQRNAEQRRRALKEGAYREQWTTPEILERDGWLCQMPACQCPNGRVIDPNAQHRWRGTADHIVPITRGGDDATHNLRAAHQACNSFKRERLDEEAFPDMT